MSHIQFEQRVLKQALTDYFFFFFVILYFFLAKHGSDLG